MGESTGSVGELAATSKDLARRLLTIGENRLELLTVEVQEEREQLMRALLLAFAVAAVGLLAAITLTAALVFLLWAYSHAMVLLILTGIYGAAGFFLFRRLTRLLREWETLAGSLDQLQKDRACLEEILA